MLPESLKSLKMKFLVLVTTSLGIIFGLTLRQGMSIPAEGSSPSSTRIICPVEKAIHVPPLTDTLLNNQKSILLLLPKKFESAKVSILIEKSKHRLTLYYDQKPIKSYPVVFGDPQGDKRQEGDRKTPEGILRIKAKYLHPSWSKFLWLDYPNAQSKCKFARSKQLGEIPLLSGIGGEIGIHGVPLGQDSLVENRTNWTLGCPALRTQDIDEIYAIIQVGTMVEIIP